MYTDTISVQAAGVLKNLSSRVSAFNAKKQPVTDGMVGAIETGIRTVLDTLESLAEFKMKHVSTVPLLSSLPISVEHVGMMKNELP